MAKLTPESPRLFRPTLAAWIGLNESIFLEQLNFILTDTDKGRFADGRKWYRDTPRAFMIQYFPFWDESIVKRTIANLRADALILARSDLNDDHKDRSLWYTINYPTLERLDGPVARITGKVAKRKEARKARKTGADEVPGRYSQPEYTKVQNVLLPEVQSVPRVQNVPTPQVQNVPTPKDSLIKESITTTRDTAAKKLETIYLLGANGRSSQSGVDLVNDMLNTYPAEVIIYACGEAEKNTTPSDDKRNLKYIEAVCKRKVSGQPDKIPRKNGATHGTHQRSNKQPTDRRATYDKSAHDAELEALANPRPHPG